MLLPLFSQPSPRGVRGCLKVPRGFRVAAISVSRVRVLGGLGDAHIVVLRVLQKQTQAVPGGPEASGQAGRLDRSMFRPHSVHWL